MTILLVGLVAVAAVLMLLRRAIANDGYGTRPPPRSHRDVADVDNRGMPTKYAQLR
jgi:hypothetical protein